MTLWLNLFFGSIGVLGLLTAIRVLLDLRFAQRLPAIDPSDVVSPRPKVSVIMPARNEEARIETSVRHLFGQRGIELELIVVDDRSTDQTTKVLRRLGNEDPRLTVVRVDALPDGWLGKCHACDAGTALATGEWILFTDADVRLNPDVILRAIVVAEREGADHICLTPGVAPGTLPAQAWHLCFLLGLAGWLSRVNRDRPRAFLGMGAFNLTRASAYRSTRGYEALRLTVVDDVKLGLILRRAGKRTRGFIGGDDAECHWPSNVRGLIKIMEKNYFAIVDYRFYVVVAAALSFGLFFAGGVIGPWTGSLAGRAAGIGFFSLAVPAAVIARRLGWSPGAALLTPFIFPLLAFAMLNSAIVTLRQGGVRWRDTFYPLELLRKFNVR